MSDYTWDQVDVDESITEQDQATSNDLNTQAPVGTFLCTVMECTPVEKDFNAYSCMAAALKLRIDDIQKIELPVLDGSSQPIKREGEVVMKAQPIPDTRRAELEALYLGQIIKDEVLLFHPKEKENTKRRRLFVAKRLGLITPQATSIGGREWKNAPGHQAIVTTVWNSWEDKTTKEIKRNVKVDWAGYETYTPGAEQGGRDVAQNDFSGI